MSENVRTAGTHSPPRPSRPEGEGWVKCELCKADDTALCPYCKGLGWYQPEKVADDGGEA